MTHLIANWPAPDNICALTTTRTSGFSHGAFAKNNMGLNVNDNNESVYANRNALKTELKLPNDPIWLNQTHTNRCVIVESDKVDRHADAAVTRQRQFPLAIMTADCLPIVLCNKQGDEIAAIHAGWRGLASGIIENTLDCMQSLPENCLAWIGPSICEACYETGTEVLQEFSKKYSFAERAFHFHNERLHANLPKLAELVLQSLGVTYVYPSMACTFESSEQFYSYRRSAETGRMATLIWFKD